MSQLNLSLPDSLQQELTVLAEYEGLPLNQYILYALTRQVTQTYRAWKLPDSEIQNQQQSFEALLEQLGQATPETVQTTLQSREQVAPEPALASSTIARLRSKMSAATEQAKSIEDMDAAVAAQFRQEW